MERLENILEELQEAIVVCAPSARILLVNPQARQLFNNIAALNPGHSLYGVCHQAPFEHAFQILRQGPGDGGRLGNWGEEAVFVCATVYDQMLLVCHMRLIRTEPVSESVYVLTFNQLKERIDETARKGNLLSRMIEDLRSPLANLNMASENLQANPEMAPEVRIEFARIIATESADLIQRFASVVQESRTLTLTEWPLFDVYSADLVRRVVRKLNAEDKIKVTMTGLPLWLQADPHSMTLTLQCLVRAVQKICNVPEIDIEVLPGERGGYFDIVWKGQPVPQEIVESWSRIPLPAISEGMTVADVLERHNSDMWCQHHQRQGYALLRIPAPASSGHWQGPVKIAAERPAVYDLYPDGRNNAPEEMIEDQPLSSLTYVVLKTETTGFYPAKGDDILAIAGVKIVNRRIISDESFQHLVNPYRPIPGSSVRCHGISNDTVRGEPPIKVVLPKFRSFVDDAVLIGHNVGFDMKFIKQMEGKAGVKFDNMVLDTILLSAVADAKTTEQYTPEGLKQRLGVNFKGISTVMGDCLLTARIFLDLLDLLEAKGITTLGQALAASKRAAAERMVPARL